MIGVKVIILVGKKINNDQNVCNIYVYTHGPIATYRSVAIICSIL